MTPMNAQRLCTVTPILMTAATKMEMSLRMFSTTATTEIQLRMKSNKLRLRVSSKPLHQRGYDKLEFISEGVILF
jgi:hypothetical protein